MDSSANTSDPGNEAEAKVETLVEAEAEAENGTISI
jgi:hypothetical protein